MTNEPSPRPWHTANFINGIEDANNGKVAANIRDADAALIVDAVNHMDYDLSIRTELNGSRAEIDRLRDIVRRMIVKLAVLNAGYRLMLSEGPEDAEMADLCTRTEALVREARAAIVEDAR